jgi:drug/metabolite transporter (DMT)-like permease
VLRAKLYVVAGALLFSTGGVAIKLSTLTGWQVSCLRSAVAALVLGIVLSRTEVRWTWRAWLVAVPYAATFTLYTLANKATTAAHAIFLQDTAPLYILVLGPLLLRERARGRDLGFMLALGLGLGLIFVAGGERSATAPNPGFGNVLGACSGISWALTLLGLRWLAIRSSASAEHPLTAIVAGCLLAAIVGAMFAFPFSDVRWVDWSIVSYLGVFQIALAYLFVTSGIRQLTALAASLLLLVEPVLTPVWAWLLLAEAPPALALGGGAVVIAATVGYSMSRPTTAGA